MESKGTEEGILHGRRYVQIRSAFGRLNRPCPLLINSCAPFAWFSYTFTLPCDLDDATRQALLTIYKNSYKTALVATISAGATHSHGSPKETMSA